MTDIKSIVIFLCNTVNEICDFKIEPFHFKFAKYNKIDEEVVPKFWNLINHLINVNYNSDIVNNVKLYFAELNYKNIEFYSLPEDMSYGSRELLLAFSWLIAKYSILENFIKQKIQKSVLSQEFIPTVSGNCDEENNIKINLNTIKEYQNYILLLTGKINNNLKMISEINDKIISLMGKVHKDSEISNKIHLSVAETYTLKKSESLKLYVSHIRNISNILDIYTKWKSKEKYYWDWMTTIINKKNEDTNIIINKEVLNSFFIILRSHAKHLLTDKFPSNTSMLNMKENKFIRCIKNDKASGHCMKNLSKIENNLKDISINEDINIQKILVFLEKMM